MPSTAVADAFGGRAGLAAVVPNGIGAGPAAAAGLDRAGPRERLGLPPGFVFRVFSRLAPWKGQDVAPRALASLPGARCIIVGDAPFGESDYAASRPTKAWPTAWHPWGIGPTCRI